MSQETGEPGNGLQVLLATNRPAVRGFFGRLGGREEGAVAVNPLPLAPTALCGAHRAVAAAAVAVVDAGSDPVAAVALCHELRVHRADLPAIALVCCPHALTHWHVQALAGCVDSFLDLHAGEEEVLRALRSVAAGHVVLRLDLGRGGQALLERLAGGAPGRPAGPARYPAGELDVRIVELVAAGLPDREIARRLHLSPHTVSHHVGRLSEQIGVRNRTALAAWAGAHGLYRSAADGDEPISIPLPTGLAAARR
jgi:DNA-binding NarL/FixJ family response regulator